MHSNRLYTLLLLVVAIVAVAQASWLDNNRINQRAVVRRQDTGGTAGGSTGGDTANDADSPSPTDDEPTADPTDGDDAASTPTDDATDNTPEESTSSAPPPAEETTASSAAENSQTSAAPEQSTTEPAPTTRSSSSSTSVQEESTTAPAEETSQTTQAAESSSKVEEKESKTSASAVVSTKVEVVTKTNDDGSKETMTSISRSTSTPDLNADNSDDSDGGMSDSTRNTIIGVVVGIGGAIMLGAIGLVAWRIWGRRKRAEENDALMDYDHGRTYGQTGAEKTEPPSTAGGSTAPSRSPFQQTLENYHQPSHVNASSNF